MDLLRDLLNAFAFEVILISFLAVMVTIGLGLYLAALWVWAACRRGMLHILAAAVLLALASSARADQFDYFCLYASQAAAQADPVVGTYWHPATSDGPASWDQSRTFPGVKVVTPSAIVNGISALTGWWIVVSSAGDNAALDGDTACVMKLNRDVASKGGAFVAAATLTGAGRTNLTFSPVPAGSAYPSPLGQ